MLRSPLRAYPKIASARGVLTFVMCLSILRSKERALHADLIPNAINCFGSQTGITIMNYIKASVTSIDTFESITLVDFSAGAEALTMMSLELDRSLKVGSVVVLAIKASAIALAKEKNAMLSISNQLPASISSIDNGILLSSVKLLVEDTVLESIITKKSALRMKLKAEDEVVALFKASDLFIAEIL